MNGGDGTLEWFDCELSAMIWDVLNTRIKSLF